MMKEYMTQLLKDAAAAHHVYEKSLGGPDANWEGWYAAHMLTQMRNDFGYRVSNPLHYDNYRSVG